MAADLSGDLTDLLLVDTLDVHVGVVGNLEGDALGSLDDHGVREAQGELEVLALLLHAVTDAGELELLLEALGNANNHVVDEGAGEAVAGTGLTLVVGTGNGEDVVLDVDSELLKDIELELALGALDDNVVAVDCHFDSGGNLDRLITDTRHGDLLSFYLPSELPDVSDDLAADVVLASIAVGHDAMAGGNNGGTKATADAGHVGNAGVLTQARLGNAADAVDDLSLLGTILKRDVQSLLGNGVLDIVALDVALLVQNTSDLDELLAARHGDRGLVHRVSVTDARKHICDRVCKVHTDSPSFLMNTCSWFFAALNGKA